MSPYVPPLAVPDWLAGALRWIEDLPPGAEFTADDLTASLGPPERRAATGTALSLASRRGLVQRAGVRPSLILSSHGSVIQVWRRG